MREHEEKLQGLCLASRSQYWPNYTEKRRDGERRSL